jgi:hypothetical protein
VFGGYRAMAIAGVALSEQQIPRFISDAASIQNIDSNGHVILHGAFAGVEYHW